MDELRQVRIPIHLLTTCQNMIIVSFFNAISIVCCSQVMTSMGEEPVSEQEFQDFAKVVVTHSQYSCIFYALVFPFAHPVTSDFGQISGPSARCRWITELRRWKLWFLASFKSDVQLIFDVVLQGSAPLSVIEEMLFIGFCEDIISCFTCDRYFKLIQPHLFKFFPTEYFWG